MSKNNYSISFIFPIYNEEKRLTNLFKNLTKFELKNNNCEYIFVNDGSLDRSLNYILTFIKKNKKKNYRIISYKKNKGKGFALKEAVKIAKKKWILTLDADLSVKLEQILYWFKNYEINKKKVYFGSRNHDLSIIEAKTYRKLIGKILNIFIELILSKKISYIKDTQCGFKLYPNIIGKLVFNKISIFNFAHDIEILTILVKKNIKVLELPIKWKHHDDSKVNIFLDSIKFLFSIFQIKRKYF